MLFPEDFIEMMIAFLILSLVYSLYLLYVGQSLPYHTMHTIPYSIKAWHGMSVAGSIMWYYVLILIVAVTANLIWPEKFQPEVGYSSSLKYYNVCILKAWDTCCWSEIPVYTRSGIRWSLNRVLEKFILYFEEVPLRFQVRYWCYPGSMLLPTDKSANHLILVCTCKLSMYLQTDYAHLRFNI